MRWLRFPSAAPGLLCIAILGVLVTPSCAATLTFTLTASEPVTVTGTPRIAIDVGGTTRYATYSSGSGTTSLTFAYAVQPGDFDANGVTIASPIDLNGGAIADLAGNPPPALAFTLPDTAALKVQTYTASFIGPITGANSGSIGFSVAKAPTGASFSYSITSSGGSAGVAGSGTISGTSHSVSGLDVSALPSGTLTLSVTVSTPAGGTGLARTAATIPAFTGALDGVTAAAAAFSLRRLTGSYSGPLIRVRRASDGAQQDIRATIAGDLDTAALGAFCAATSCYVSAWYDQSGNARDATQATAANQPRIVNAGAIETKGGRPTIVWPSVANTSLLRTATIFTLGSVSVVSQYDDGARTGWIADYVGLFGSTGVSIGANVAGTSTLYGSPSFQKWARNGAALANSSLAVALPWSWSTMYATASPAFGGFWSIGCDRTLSLRGWSGPISEFLMFPAALSASDRLSIERSQASYFGVAVP